MRRAFRALGPALIAGLLPAAAIAGSYGQSAIGTTAAEFLQLGAGARASGMGEAYSAAAEDADALYWNPAALTNIDHKSATLMQVPYLASSEYEYAAYGQRLGERGAFGIGLQYFSAGSISQTDQIGTPLGSYSPSDLAFSAGYAYRFPGGYSLGGAVKLVRSSVLDTGQTFAGDLGVLSPLYFDRARLAFTLTNVGKPLNYGNGGSENLPQTLRAGASLLANKDWMATFDVVAPRENAPYVDLGTEYWIARDARWGVAGRIGYSTLTGSGLQGFTGVSFGTGVRFHEWTMDYALVPYGSLGLTQRISLTVRWDKIDVHLKIPEALSSLWAKPPEAAASPADAASPASAASAASASAPARALPAMAAPPPPTPADTYSKVLRSAEPSAIPGLTPMLDTTSFHGAGAIPASGKAAVAPNPSSAATAASAPAGAAATATGAAATATGAAATATGAAATATGPSSTAPGAAVSATSSGSKGAAASGATGAGALPGLTPAPGKASAGADSDDDWEDTTGPRTSTAPVSGPKPGDWFGWRFGGWGK